MHIDKIERELETLIHASMVNCFEFIEQNPIAYALDQEATREDKVQTLDKMITFFEEKEEYERCADIVNWKELLIPEEE